jgi:hypothetical protein
MRKEFPVRDERIVSDWKQASAVTDVKAIIKAVRSADTAKHIPSVSGRDEAGATTPGSAGKKPATTRLAGGRTPGESSETTS